jgi:hypothetical protein
MRARHGAWARNRRQWGCSISRVTALERDVATVDDATGALLGAHIRGFITDREIASIDEACELEDSSWLAVKPEEHERFAPRPKLSREHNQRSDTGRVDETTVLEVEDKLTFRAAIKRTHIISELLGVRDIDFTRDGQDHAIVGGGDRRQRVAICLLAPCEWPCI